MLRRFVLALVALCVLLFGLGTPARAQDSAPSGEPLTSVDPATLSYDFLVDGDLIDDDPANRQFRTVQAAYDAALKGTADRPTVIGIAPNVYLLPGSTSGASLNVTKSYITLLGLTNNRRGVVLADNRGNAQGASDNGYVIIVNATGFTAENLTILNYCNVDYEYPGDPSKNLSKRSAVITQAVALQASGDKHVYRNVALLSRLDTMFLQTTRSYFKSAFIEGTDDFIGGGTISAWEDAEIFFPTGSGVMSASNVAFINSTFISSGGLQFSKTGSVGVALINCVMTAPGVGVAWVRGNAAPRPAPTTARTRKPCPSPARSPRTISAAPAWPGTAPCRAATATSTAGSRSAIRVWRSTRARLRPCRRPRRRLWRPKRAEVAAARSRAREGAARFWARCC
jgi:hypothetical protein